MCCTVGAVTHLTRSLGLTHNLLSSVYKTVLLIKDQRSMLIDLIYCLLGKKRHTHINSRANYLYK